MASSMPPRNDDPFGQYNGKMRLLEEFVGNQEANDLVRLAVASRVLKNFLIENNFPRLNRSVIFARQSHEEVMPGAMPAVNCFTRASLLFSASDEGSRYLKMLDLLQAFNDNPFWLTFAVVLAKDHKEAQRVKTFIEASRIYVYLSHGHPAPATRRNIFRRNGLAVMVLYRLGGELDQIPEVMVCLQPPANELSFRQILAIGSRHLYMLPTLEEEHCLAACQLRNSMEEFNCRNTVMPHKTILPAGDDFSHTSFLNIVYFTRSYWAQLQSFAL